MNKSVILLSLKLEDESLFGKREEAKTVLKDIMEYRFKGGKLHNALCNCAHIGKLSRMYSLCKFALLK